MQVQVHGDSSLRGNGLIMASVIKMAAAAKLAEERIRLDIGGNMCPVEDDEVMPQRKPYAGSLCRCMRTTCSMLS